MKSFLQALAVGLSAICVGSVAASEAQHQASHGSHANELHIMNGWIRALPPTQKVTAAYLTLHNASDNPITIDGFSSAVAASAELHDSVLQDGQIRMVKQETLVLAPDEHKTLQPAGLHIMLMGLDAMPREGDQVEVCVKSGELKSCKAVPVLKMTPVDAMPHHQHQ